MTTIKERTFDGAAGIGRGSSDPDLATTLQEVADDLAALNAAGNRPAVIASPDAVASVGVPTKIEFDAVVLLVNEIKAALNAVPVAGPTLTTIRG